MDLSGNHGTSTVILHAKDGGDKVGDLLCFLSRNLSIEFCNAEYEGSYG